MFLNNEVLNWNNRLYHVFKKVRRETIKEEYVQFAKEFWHCDVVVRQTRGEDNLLLFLREISDVEILN